MKKLILSLGIILLSINVSAQSFRGFFKPVDRSLFKAVETIDQDVRVDQRANLWLVRPVVTVTALQFLIGNPVEVVSLNSMGTGLSYQNIVMQNDTPYTRFAINGLILFTADIGEVQPASLSFAVTGSFWQYLSVGAGYSISKNKIFLLSGIVYNFNNVK